MTEAGVAGMSLWQWADAVYPRSICFWKCLPDIQSAHQQTFQSYTGQPLELPSNVNFSTKYSSIMIFVKVSMIFKISSRLGDCAKQHPFQFKFWLLDICEFQIIQTFEYSELREQGLPIVLKCVYYKCTTAKSALLQILLLVRSSYWPTS